MWFKALGELGDTAKILPPGVKLRVDRYVRYPAFAKAEEGFTELACKFRGVAAIEKAHEERYRPC